MRPLVLLLLCAGLACDGTSPVVLGSAGPWKEPFGAAARRGVELAVAEVNASGGIGGRELVVEYRDDGGDGARAAVVAEEFVEDPRISGVVGHITSGAMLSAAKLYDGRLAAVSPTATSPDLSGLSAWAFRVIPSDSANGAALARAANALGHGRAAILFENDGYGRGLSDAFRRAFRGAVVSEDAVDAVVDDPEPYITALRTRAQPDVVLVAGTEGSGLTLLREARRQGLEADFLGGDGWTGIVSDPAVAEGVLVGAPFTTNDQRPEAQRFVKAYRARFREDPDGNAAMAYDAAQALIAAVREVGPGRRAVRDWLAARQGGASVVGVAGPIRFDARGDPVGRGLVLTRVRAGRLVIEGSAR